MTHEVPPEASQPLDPAAEGTNFDPAAFGPAVNPGATPEGYTSPEPTTEEDIAALEAKMNNFASETAGKSYADLTLMQRIHAVQILDSMSRLPVSDREFFNTETANAIRETGAHAHNQFILGRMAKAYEQREEAAAAREAHDDARRREEAEVKHQQQQAIEDAQRRVDAARAAASLTPEQKKANSQAALKRFLDKIKDFNSDDLKPDDLTLRGELNDEDVHFLDLALEDRIRQHPNAPNRMEVGILRQRTQNWNGSATIKLEKSLPDNRFTKVERNFQEYKRQLQEKQEAGAAWDEAHDIRYPRHEAPSIRALHDYMEKAHDARDSSRELPLKERIKEQSELLHKINDDNRALKTFISSNLVADEDLRNSAKKYLADNQRFMEKYRRELLQRAPLKTAEIEADPKNPAHRGIPTHRMVADRARPQDPRPESRDPHERYDTLFANEHRTPLEAAPTGIESKGLKKVLEYFNHPENHGNTLAKKPGSLSDKITKRAQLNRLVRDVAGDPAAEAELRRRGISTRFGLRGRVRKSK